MRTETITRNVYMFNELSDNAKETAREWYRQRNDYPWIDDALQSVRAFCDKFAVRVQSYEIGIYGYSYISTDVKAGNFRGLKLKTIDREAMPTGYCLDNDLMYTLYDTFKKTGDAYGAFCAAIDAACSAIVQDIEDSYSDEQVDEILTINEYEFTENGKVI